MTIPQSVAEILHKHVTLEVEGIDRMYLNVYVPRLQIVEGVLGFIRRHGGHPVASTRMVEPITRQFVAAIEKFVHDHHLALVCFDKGQRKEDIAAAYRAEFSDPEGVVFVGKAQEKCTVSRTEKRRNPHTGRTYAWIVKSTALVNHYYFYCMDRDFGPFFLKFCSYFPYNAKLCLNGHEYVKRQLAQQGIAYEALDNGILSCQNPQRLQALCDGLSAAKIEALLRKWLRLLPHPFSARDRQAGYRYDLSILQIELSLTQVLDRPLIAAPSDRNGDGFCLQSLDLHELGERASPIIVLHDFRVRGRPFAPHSRVVLGGTYMFEDLPGDLRTRDSLGHDFVTGPGGIVWTQAGSGVIHEELPAEANRELHGLQVFVNLSLKNKLVAPQGGMGRLAPVTDG